jgi:hypothetical protein
MVKRFIRVHFAGRTSLPVEDLVSKHTVYVVVSRNKNGSDVIQPSNEPTVVGRLLQLYRFVLHYDDCRIK